MIRWPASFESLDSQFSVVALLGTNQEAKNPIFLKDCYWSICSRIKVRGENLFPSLWGDRSPWHRHRKWPPTSFWPLRLKKAKVKIAGFVARRSCTVAWFCTKPGNPTKICKREVWWCGFDWDRYSRVQGNTWSPSSSFILMCYDWLDSWEPAYVGMKVIGESLKVPTLGYGKKW